MVYQAKWTELRSSDPTSRNPKVSRSIFVKPPPSPKKFWLSRKKAEISAKPAEIYD